MNERPPDRRKDPGPPIVPPPPPRSPVPPGPASSDPVSTLIPYNNPQALAAYYLGVFSLIPGIGLFTGIAAVVMGVLGLRLYKAHPEVRGKVHAWIGIIVGGILAFLNILGLIVAAGALFAAASEM